MEIDIGFDELGRPNWDLFFMGMAIYVSQRSLDPDTKHGTVVVDSDHNLLCVGYNGPPRGCDDSMVPLTRPKKYDWFIHSEEAAIDNAARMGKPVKNSTFYITGMPCAPCFSHMISVGVKRIVYGPVGCHRDSHCVFDGTEQLINQMILSQKPEQRVELIKFDKSLCDSLFKIYEKSTKYLLSKIQQNNV